MTTLQRSGPGESRGDPALGNRAWPPPYKPTPPATRRPRRSSWPCSRRYRPGSTAAKSDKTLLDRLVDIRSAETDDRDGSDTEAAYTEAFREAGIDLADMSPAEAGAKIKARPTSVALALAAALDDWAAIRRGRRADAAGAARLSEAARAADPDPWRTGLRTALDQSDKAARLTALQPWQRRRNPMKWARSACTCWGPV